MKKKHFRPPLPTMRKEICDDLRDLIDVEMGKGNRMTLFDLEVLAKEKIPGVKMEEICIGRESYYDHSRVFLFVDRPNPNYEVELKEYERQKKETEQELLFRQIEEKENELRNLKERLGK